MCMNESSLDIGTEPLTLFFRITLPIISPYLLAGSILAFTLSLDHTVNDLVTIIISLVTLSVTTAGMIMRPRLKL